ncbi:MAG: hypothetical protein WBA07_14445, partial [Rivularia sp. (in: cyanobacteria)]
MLLPSSENHESSAELREEVENLSNIASNIDSEMQAKIRGLLAQIKTSLQQQQLSIEIQRELARLLTLISTLNYRNSQHVDILDLAISILLENKEDVIQNKTNSNFTTNKVSNKNSRNLVFIQEARRQIAIQSREYPHPFSAIIKGSGGAYNRLLSGLSWFFIIFVICPILASGLTFVALNTIGAIKQVEQSKNIELLTKELENKEKQLQTTNEIRNSLQVRLEKVNGEIKKINQNNNLSGDMKEITSKVGNLNDNIEKELESISIKEKEDNTSQNNQPVKIDENRLITLTNLIYKSPIFSIFVAVSMGALGSAVSVIVRANKFIEKGKEGQSDLFFTGFFRPIVGMSFAIFAVAVIESGIFSGVFKITQDEDSTVYLYMTIAFLAGFSERLVEDVVLKTENSLTGFSPRSDKPEK